MNITKKQPLFMITGASGVGKSSVCNILFRNETKYIVMESDLLWDGVYDTPDDDYHNWRKLWLNICANISQIGMPVVLCGCTTPDQNELHEERKLFTKIYYIAITCNDSELENRMRNGRGINDENYIKSSIDFTNWLIENENNPDYPIKNIDTTLLSPEQAAEAIDKWICERIL